jgi:hypothetical protein
MAYPVQLVFDFILKIVRRVTAVEGVCCPVPTRGGGKAGSGGFFNWLFLYMTDNNKRG